MKMNWRKVRVGILLYLMLDLFIGGTCGGLLQLTPLAAAQQGLLGRSQVLNSEPAIAATASVSFPAAPEKWVFDQVCFSGSASGGAVAATNINLNIRDGATGAGTVLASFAVGAVGASGAQVILPFCTALGFTGSFNTAATAEFSGGAANLQETVTFFVHKAQ